MGSRVKHWHGYWHNMGHDGTPVVKKLGHGMVGIRQLIN